MDEAFSQMMHMSESYANPSFEKCDFTIYLEQLGYDFDRLQQGYTYMKANVVDPANDELTYDMTQSWSKSVLWRFTGSRNTAIVDEAFESWRAYVSLQNERFMDMAGRFDYEIENQDYKHTVEYWQGVFDKMNDLIERYQALSVCSLNLKMYLHANDFLGSVVELVTILIAGVMIGVLVIITLSGRARRPRRQKRKDMEKV